MFINCRQMFQRRTHFRSKFLERLDNVLNVKTFISARWCICRFRFFDLSILITIGFIRRCFNLFWFIWIRLIRCSDFNWIIGWFIKRILQNTLCISVSTSERLRYSPLVLDGGFEYWCAHSYFDFFTRSRIFLIRLWNCIGQVFVDINHVIVNRIKFFSL